MNTEHIHVVSHPLIDHSMTVIRDKTATTEQFRKHATVLSTMLLIEATKHLSVQPKSIETPLALYEGKELVQSIVLVPVLRAGLSMLFAAQELLPEAAVGFVGLARDEETAIATSYYKKLPNLFSKSQIFILDPMLATGGSLTDTIREVEEQGGADITAVCVVAASEGIAAVHATYPQVPIYTAAIDERLNEKKYIVPGLGDFGDRYFST